MFVGDLSAIALVIAFVFVGWCHWIQLRIYP